MYNLTVEGASEFFANGVLVHNCDTCSYMHQMLPFVRSAGLTASRPFTIHESKSGPFSGLT